MTKNKIELIVTVISLLSLVAFNVYVDGILETFIVMLIISFAILILESLKALTVYLFAKDDSDDDNSSK